MFAAVIFLSIVQKRRNADETETVEEIQPQVEIAKAADINEVGMIEDTSVYDADDPESIVYFYVTV